MISAKTRYICLNQIHHNKPHNIYMYMAKSNYRTSTQGSSAAESHSVISTQDTSVGGSYSITSIQGSSSCSETKTEPLIPLHQIEEYSSIKDKFSFYQAIIRHALEIYERAKLLTSISDPGLKETIYRKAEPFRKGHFTMVVIGKMSAGKSTFINAFLHNRNLLPTGHLQTTCALTTIKNTKNKSLYVTYGDERKEVFKGDFETCLSELVSIKKKYQNIPINTVNLLTLSGKNKELICSKKIVDELTSIMGYPIDVDLLGEYIDEHPINVIPLQVDIRCPLPEEYLGWQIVDTPGVDAIGGVEEETTQFLSGSDEDGNHNVDAIVFIFSAKGNIQEKSLFQFMSSTLDSVTEEARSRCFFIINKGADRDFLSHKEDIMGQIDTLFVRTGKIAKSRIIVVDSLCSLLAEDETMDYKYYAKMSSPCPPNWNKDDWGTSRTLLGDIRMELEDDDTLEYNNENVRQLLEKKSNFQVLRASLSEFVSQEKEMAFKSIIELIIEEIQKALEIKESDKQVLTKGLGQSPEQFKETLQQEKNKFDSLQLETNKLVTAINSEYSNTKVLKEFLNVISDLAVLEAEVSKRIDPNDKKESGYLSFISKFPYLQFIKADFPVSEGKGMDLEGFSELLSWEAMVKKANSCVEQVESIAKEITDNLLMKAKNYLANQQNRLVVNLPPIDYATIKNRAKEKTATTTTEEKKSTPKKGFWNRIKRTFGSVFGTNWGWNVKQQTVKHYHEDKANYYAIYETIFILYDEIAKFIKTLQEQIRSVTDQLDKSIKEKIKNRKETIENYESKNDLVSNIERLIFECTVLHNSLKSLSIYQDCAIN